MNTPQSNEHREQAREVVDKYRLPNGQVAADLMRDIASALSSRDAEVKQVLEGLRPEVNRDCWCRHCSDGHSNTCLAARALWEKVQPGSTTPALLG